MAEYILENAHLIGVQFPHCADQNFKDRLFPLVAQGGFGALFHCVKGHEVAPTFFQQSEDRIPPVYLHRADQLPLIGLEGLFY